MREGEKTRRREGEKTGGAGPIDPLVFSSSRLLVCALQRADYSDVLELQRAIARARIAGDLANDVLLLVEHPPVITLGRSTSASHVVAGPELLAARGVLRVEVDRGGDATFHGPGQLVGYPIFDLKRHRQDLHWYLRQLEGALIAGVAEFGVHGIRNPGYTGVWVEDRKLASIGVHARDWVTWHGFALNVTTDLSWFDLIVPCGIPGVAMTSVHRELSRANAVGAPEHDAHPERPALADASNPSLFDHVSEAVVRGIESVFGMSAAPIPLEWLRTVITAERVVTT